MAAKPTLANAAFATDTNFASGPASGTPVKVQPSAIAAQGWRPGDALGFVGAWLNWLFFEAYLWFTYVNDLHNSADFLNKAYTWITSVHRFTGGIRMVNPRIESGNLLYSDSAGTLAPIARSIMLPFSFQPGDGGVLGHWGVSSGGSATSIGGPAQDYLPISLPAGCVITGVVACAVDTAAQNVTIELIKDVPDALSGAVTRTTPGAADTSDGSATAQILTIGAVSETVSAAARYSVFVGASAASQNVSYVQVNYTDPGFVGN